VLESLLPGAREVRAPLVAGYAVLLASWLLFRQQIASSTSGFVRLRAAADGISDIGVAIAASVTAYLVGAILIEVAAWLSQLRARPFVESESNLRLWLAKNLRITQDLDYDMFMQDIQKLAHNRTGSLTAEQLGLWTNVEGDALGNHRVAVTDLDLRDSEVPSRVAELVLAECMSDRLDARLITKSSEIFNEVRRLRSESELRTVLFVPGMYLSVGLAYDLNQGWFSGIALLAVSVAFLGALFLLGVRVRIKEHKLIMRSVLDGVISTPTLDRLEQVSSDSWDCPVSC